MRTSINFFSEKTLRIIFASLFIVFCSSAYSESKTKTFLTQSKLVKLTFPSGHYKNTDDNPYDLQVFSKYMKESTGVFEFLASDLAEDFQAKDIFAMQIADIRSKRKNFKPYIFKSASLDKEKIITTETYTGEKNNFKYVYIFSLIEFKETGIVVVVLQTSLPSDWNRKKEMLLNIVKSAKEA